MKTKTIKKKATVKKKAVSKKATTNNKNKSKEKPIKKGYLDVVLKDKDGRSESVTYYGYYDDEYLIKYIAEKISKLKLGWKLTIEPMEILK